MRVVFADTSYFLALPSSNDHHHAAAIRASKTAQRMRIQLLTTTWVLVEVGDALSKPAFRPRFMSLVDAIQKEPAFEVLPPTESQFRLALALFDKRMDKSWSLTDCTSFAVMQERGLVEALTFDRHFKQAGFTAFPSSS